MSLITTQKITTQNATSDQLNTIAHTRGIYGFGLSNNAYLDLLNLTVLAFAGIFIKVFFSSSTSTYGENGPASTTVWGYGLTSLSLFIMIFMAYYLDAKDDSKSKLEDESINFFTIIGDFFLSSSLPIILTLGVIVYIIYLNFIYLERINKGLVPDTYSTYSLFSSILLVIQLILIVKYLFAKYDIISMYSGKTGKKEREKLETQNSMIKSVTFILTTINFIFVLIMNILLGFYSTGE